MTTILMLASSSSLSKPADSKDVLVDTSAGLDEPNFEVNKHHTEKKQVKKKKKKRSQKSSSHEDEAGQTSVEAGPKVNHAPKTDTMVTDSEVNNAAAPTTRTIKSTKSAKRKPSSRTVAKPKNASILETVAAETQDNQAAFRAVPPEVAAAIDRTVSLHPNPASRQQYSTALAPAPKSSQRHRVALARDLERMENGSHSQNHFPQGSHATDLDRLELGVPLNQMASRSIPFIQKDQPPYQGEKDILYDPPKQHTTYTLPMGECCLSIRSEDERYESINDDVYNMFFLSRVGGPAFFYAAYVFLLKMTLYSVLVSDVIGPHQGENARPPFSVLIVQFLILPVAVAMQEDLIATFHLIANIKYCPSIKSRNPDASQIKFHIANFCRGIDGAFSLAINYIVLIRSQDILSMFLNFAALQFLQVIDNVALDLAADGHLSNQLEAVARNVKEAKLLTQDNPRFTMLDTVLFCITLLVLLLIWFFFHFF